MTAPIPEQLRLSHRLGDNAESSAPGHVPALKQLHIPMPALDTEHRSTSVLIVEGHRLYGECLDAALTRAGFASILSAGDSAQGVIGEARRLAPDLVILDLQLANAGDGYDLIRRLATIGATVLVLTGVTDRIQLAMCLEAGAIGVVTKAVSFTGLLEQVRRAARGDAVTTVTVRAGYAEELRQHRVAERARTALFEALTRRELEVLGMIVEGMSAREMARDAYVSLATVRTQIRSIFQKLQVNSQLEAAAMAHACGWRPPRRHMKGAEVGWPAGAIAT